MSTNRIVAGLASGAVAGVIAITGSPAQAATDDRGRPRASDSLALLERQARTEAELRAQIALQLHTVPGGKQTTKNEISYSDGAFVVTYALPGQRNRQRCPSGWFCFYDGGHYTGAQGRLRGCGWQDLSTWGWWDRIESVHNRTRSGVDYIEHDDKYDPRNGHTLDYTLFHNSAGQTHAGVGRASNRADHVYRFC